ncbi:hypothetical protein Tco_1382763, partial [Tanacetum coccineum]
RNSSSSYNPSAVLLPNNIKKLLILTSITAQKAKLDLELVPKEKRLEIMKCNRRLNLGKIQRELTFQVVLDALALTPCYSAFLIIADLDKRKRFKLNMEVFRDIFKICPRLQGQDFDALPTNEEIVSFLIDLGYTREIHSLNDVVVDQMHQPWRTFDALINWSLSGKTSGLDKLRLSRAQILWGMYHQKNVDYVELLWEDFIYQIDNKPKKAREDVLPSIHQRATPPKKAKFKKPASPKLTTVPVSTKEPMGKSKRVKRPAKKTTKAPARGIVIQETPEIPVSKKKEKVDVTRGKGIELLSHVALNEDAQFEEVQRKSMRDFHKTRPKESSESEAESWGNDKDDSNNEQDSSDEDSEQENDSDDNKTLLDDENESDSDHETKENKPGSESDHEENEEDENDEEEAKDELVKTLSNDYDDEDEIKITDKAEGDEDEEMDYTTSQLYDDVDIRLNEPVDIDKEFVQEEGTNVAMTNNTEVLITSSSHSYDLAAKFLKFSDIPHTDAKVVSPMDVHVHHEVPSQQTPKLLTVSVSVISDSSPVFSIVIPQSLPSFTPPPQQSTSTPPPTTKATNPLSTLLDFTSIFQFNNRVTTFEKEVAELKNDPLHTQVTTLVDDHLDARLGETKK